MAKTVVKYGESVLEVSLRLYNDIRYCIDLMAANEFIDGIADTTIEGLEIEYEPIAVSKFKAPVINNNPIVKSGTIGQGQTIEDLTLQVYGTIERVFDFLSISGIENMDQNNIVGVSFNYTPLRLIVTDFAERNKFVNGTGLTDYRVTEDGEQRVTEDLIYRTLE